MRTKRGIAVMHLFHLQQYFVCDYAINVECNNAESFYSLNANFGQVTNDEEAVEEVLL